MPKQTFSQKFSQKFFITLAVLLTFTFTTKVFASLSFSSTAINSTGNALTLGTLDANNSIFISPNGTGAINFVANGATNNFTGSFTAPINDNTYYLTLLPTLTSAGSATDFRTFNVEPTLTGSVATAALRGERIVVRNSSTNTIGTFQALIGNVIHNGTSTVTTANGTTFNLGLTSTGNVTNLTGFTMNSTTASSTGDVVGDITVLQAVGAVSRASAATFTGVNIGPQTAATTLTAAYRGQIAAGATSYNAYMDGTAKNYFAGEIQTGPTPVEAARVNYNLSVYGAGAAYALTNTAAAIDFGTTDPSLTLDKAGTYLIFGKVQLAYAGATVVAETAIIKLRRTNNSAVDLTNGTLTIDLPVSTTLTHTYGTVDINPVIYTTTGNNDSIALFANVSAALGAGTINAESTGTSLVAIRLY